MRKKSANNVSPETYLVVGEVGLFDGHVYAGGLEALAGSPWAKLVRGNGGGDSEPNRALCCRNNVTFFGALPRAVVECPSPWR
jgi:hypothetical protein